MNNHSRLLFTFPRRLTPTRSRPRVSSQKRPKLPRSVQPVADMRGLYCQACPTSQPTWKPSRRWNANGRPLPAWRLPVVSTASAHADVLELMLFCGRNAGAETSASGRRIREHLRARPAAGMIDFPASSRSEVPRFYHDSRGRDGRDVRCACAMGRQGSCGA